MKKCGHCGREHEPRSIRKEFLEDVYMATCCCGWVGSVPTRLSKHLAKKIAGHYGGSTKGQRKS